MSPTPGQFEHLRQFDYHVFLSYGWSGLSNPLDGDRGWVAEFKHQLEAQLSSALGHHARIYLDVEDSQNGELPSRLQTAVSGSAVFISIISPGSCRPDSWCHRELAAFDDPDSLILPGRRQIFTILLRDVPQTEWPERLRSMTPVPFHDARGGPLPRQHLADTSTPTGQLAQSFAIDVAATVKEMAREIDNTVLLGLTAPTLERRIARIADEIRSRRSNVIRVAERAGETPQEFGSRVERLSRNASLAVHLVPESGGSLRPEWPASVEMLQIQASARRFSGESQRLIVWHEPAPGQDLRAESSLDAQVLKGSGFEYLQSLIHDCVARQTAVVTPPVPEPGGSRYVFVKCTPQDAARLAPLRAAVEARGLRIRLPIFEGDEVRRNRVNQDFIERSHGVAVYFGSLNDLEAFDACQTLWNTIQGARQPIPKAVFIDPPHDPIRSSFWYPDFQNYPSSSIEMFVEQLLAGGVS